MLKDNLAAHVRAGLILDLEVYLVVDECPFWIRPRCTGEQPAVRWECILCGKSQVTHCSYGAGTDTLIAFGTDKAGEHMMRAHPGPKTKAFFESI